LADLSPSTYGLNKNVYGYAFRTDEPKHGETLKPHTMRIIQSIAVELKNTIDEIINSEVENETYLLAESLVLLNLLKGLIDVEHEKRCLAQLSRSEKIINH